jgi:hypothetical protein
LCIKRNPRSKERGGSKKLVVLEVAGEHCLAGGRDDLGPLVGEEYPASHEGEARNAERIRREAFRGAGGGHLGLAGEGDVVVFAFGRHDLDVRARHDAARCLENDADAILDYERAFAIGSLCRQCYECCRGRKSRHQFFHRFLLCIETTRWTSKNTSGHFLRTDPTYIMAFFMKNVKR